MPRAEAGLDCAEGVESPPMLGDDRVLSESLWIAVWCVLLLWLVVALSRVVEARRPGLALYWPLLAAAAIRLAVAAFGSLHPGLAQARARMDEGSFRNQARVLAEAGLDLDSLPSSVISDLHLWIMALQLRITESPGDFFLRVGHIGLAIAALAIIAVATYDLAGVVPAKVVAWFLAFEPSNVYFSGVLHKEAPMLVGESLVILGCVRMYQRRDQWAFVLMTAGLVIGGLTRPYIAPALALGCALVMVHAAARPVGSSHRRSPALAATVVLCVGVGMAISPLSRIVDELQLHQNAYAFDDSNLKLEPVDLSTSEGIFTTGLRRGFDVLFRPYPWQIENMSQRLGVLGTAMAWFLVTVTVVLASLRPRFAASRLPPIGYVVLVLAVTYAFATANAGTGFRYRTHILFALAPAAAILVGRTTGSQSVTSGYDVARAGKALRVGGHGDRRTPPGGRRLRG